MQETTPSVNEMYLWIGIATIAFVVGVIWFEKWYDKNVRQPVEQEWENDAWDENSYN
jgi:hypothetical protein